MALTKEEVAAELLWRYVEHVREAEREGQSVALTRVELEQLVGALDTAGVVPDALATSAPEPLQSAVRRRVEQACAEAHVEARPRRRTPWRATVPGWLFAGATAAAAAVAIAVGTVDLWHPTVNVTRPPIAAPGVHEMDHQLAVNLIPRMVDDRLPPQQEKALMWHMLMCPPCFNRFEALRHPGQTATSERILPVRFAAR